ncbi:hypothetical protein DPEC_G00102450 [Dallia pectoralis]|uniref:Uncharacterized protein n=1 Tax=Dallia pectoralis TaxID=75939 RepID=A0ACC2GXN1_DALPE|nr:hypothetical protein DPEC_G00102450 [Dallia pectoralis]
MKTKYTHGSKHVMVDPEKRAVPGDAPSSTMDPSGKNKENEKKKRSRVKQLLADVKKQVDFWFGDVNLHKDRFLKQLIQESRDGYVDLSVLTSFNRMKSLTTDSKLIARALKNSSVVEVNLEGTKVRRQNPIGEDPKDSDNRTVYVELLPRNVTHDWLDRVFAKCGNVVYISVPRYKTTSHSKGFAFVEFETAEQAEKSIEMLNNPPEDAPRKPGIFPKTKNRKPIPNPPALNAGVLDEEEEKKNRKKSKSRGSTKGKEAKTEATVGEVKDQEIESEPTPKKRRRTAEGEEASAAGTDKAPAKKPGKRRRSQAGEGEESDAQGDMPSKLRRISNELEGKDKDELKGSGAEDLLVKEDEEEKMDDSLLKAKRKRKKKHKERVKTGEEVIPLRVLSKKDWLKLKEEYLILQKKSMASLKTCLTKVHQSAARGKRDVNTSLPVEDGNKVNEKTPPVGPQFVSGCIVKITNSKPLPGRQVVKEALSVVSPVVYVDTLEGDAEGHVRFNTPAEAKAIVDARTELQDKHGWQLEILSGDHEQRYWQKILVDRQAKLNRPRDKKRGTEKLISKAEKIIIARAKEATKHIRFMED